MDKNEHCVHRTTKLNTSQHDKYNQDQVKRKYKYMECSVKKEKMHSKLARYLSLKAATKVAKGRRD